MFQIMSHNKRMFRGILLYINVCLDLLCWMETLEDTSKPQQNMYGKCAQHSRQSLHVISTLQYHIYC
jgi:hypothetical protein